MTEIKRNFNKAVSLLLALIIAFCSATAIIAVAGTTIAVAETLTDGIFRYVINEEEAVLTGFAGDASGDVVVPSTLGGYPVTQISTVSSVANDITSIHLPYTVENIGLCAFCNNKTNLARITVDSENEYFSNDGYGVLFNKDKTELVSCPPAFAYSTYSIPEGVEKICDVAFGECAGITDVIIPDTVTFIGQEAFFGCNGLTEVVIPDSVTEIDYSAFLLCESLAKITLPKNLKSIKNRMFECCTNLTDVTIPVGLTSIGNLAFAECEKLINITIPDSVTSIGNSAFMYCESLTNINIPDSVEDIGKYAFSYCDSLTEVIIPNGVINIGDEAFFDCNSLTNVTVSDSVTSIGTNAFNSCGNLVNITVDEFNTVYSSDADGVLYNKNKTKLIQYPTGAARSSYEISDSVTDIGDFAFLNCKNLTGIIIPDSVTGIGKSAFQSCNNLTGVIIPGSVASIGKSAFQSCTNLTDITIPESVTTISDSVFSGCTKLAKVLLHDGVTSIGEYVFSGCISLKNITIPVNVTNIGEAAFLNCQGLTDVYYSATEEQWDAITIGAQNGSLVRSTIHFNYIPPRNVVFDYSYKTVEISVNPGDSIIPPETPALEGRRFVGWTPEIPEVMPDYDIRFNALWEIEEYTVTFIVDGNAYETMSVPYSSEISVPADPMKNGYDFTGWSPQIPETMPAENLEIYATWEPKTCKATFMLKDIVCKEIDVKFGENFDLPADITPNGYEIIRWLDSDGNEAVFPVTMSTENLTYYAEYKLLAENESFGVSATYDEDCFGDVNAELKIEPVTADKESHGMYFRDEYYSRVGIFNIEMVDENDVPVQPVNGKKVKIKMRIPDEWMGRDSYAIVHWISKSKFKTLTTENEDPEKRITISDDKKYLIFEVDHFSNFELYCIGDEVKMISVPTKTVYTYKTENLDLSGISFKVTHADGSTEIVTDTSGMKVTGFDNTKIGEQTVTVEYEGCTAQFNVTVKYSWWQWVIRILLLGFIWY